MVSQVEDNQSLIVSASMDLDQFFAEDSKGLPDRVDVVTASAAGAETLGVAGASEDMKCEETSKNKKLKYK